MRIVEKTLYKIVCVSREERKKIKKKIKTQINYINVFLNSESEIKLENKKELKNIIIEVYAVYMNAAYITAKCSSAEKCY